jgi:hypothetical protein
MGVKRKTLKVNSQEKRPRGEKITNRSSTYSALKNAKRIVNLMRGYVLISDDRCKSDEFQKL